MFRGGDHSFTLVEDLVNKSVDSSLKGLTECSKHRKVLQHFCEDHKVLCCINCALDSHTDCHYHQISETSDDSLKALGKDFIEIVNKISSLEILHQSYHDDCVAKVGRLLKQIEEIKKNVGELLYDLSHPTQSGPESPRTNGLTHIQWCRCIVREAIENQNLKLNFFVGHQIRERLDHFIRLVKDSHDTNNALRGIVDSCEEATAVLKCRNEFIVELFGAWKKSKNEDTALMVPLPNDARIEKYGLRICYDRSFDALFEESGMLNIIDVAHMAGERMIFLDEYSNACFITDDAMTYRIGKPYTFQTTARGLTVVNDKDIAVTVCSDTIKKICILDTGDNRRLKLKRTLIVSKYCDAICHLPHQEFVVSTFNDVTGVIKIDPNETESPIRGLSLKRQFFDFRDCRLAFDSDLSKLLILDKDESCIYCHDFISNTSCVISDGNLSDPYDITPGPDGVVFVSDSSGIACLSQDGEVIWKHNLELEGPHLISTNAEKTKLFVVSSRVNRLSTFNIGAQHM